MLTSIEHTQGFHYQVMNLEVWALVETLDRVFPGAWGHFMTNRQVAVKQFLQRHDPNTAVDAVDAADAGDAQEKGEEGTRKQKEGKSQK